MVYGCIRMNPIVRFTRNMIVIREAGKLTLINPVRMNSDGLAALEALGDVAHVLRLGALHGLDDEFYVHRYQAAFWSFAGGVTYTKPDIDHVLHDGGPLPFKDAQLLGFNCLKQPEGVILLQGKENLLIATDAIQTYSTPPHYPHTNKFTQWILPLVGFTKHTLIGPAWMKLMVADPVGIQAEFERVLALDFDQLLPTHGTYLASGAHAAVQAAYDKMFKD